MAKRSKKEIQLGRLYECEDQLSSILYSFSLDQLMDHILNNLIELSVYDLNHDIENELNYAKYDTSSYASAKKEAKARAGILKKRMNSLEKFRKQVNDAYAPFKGKSLKSLYD